MNTGTALFLAVILLIVIMVGFGYLLSTYQDQTQELESLRQQLESLSQQYETSQQLLATTQEELAEAQQQGRSKDEKIERLNSALGAAQAAHAEAEALIERQHIALLELEQHGQADRREKEQLAVQLDQCQGNVTFMQTLLQDGGGRQPAFQAAHSQGGVLAKSILATETLASGLGIDRGYVYMLTALASLLMVEIIVATYYFFRNRMRQG